MSEFARAPLDLGGESVQSAWIDYNGHMNVAYYVLAFDHAVDRLFDAIGLGPNHVAEVGSSLFVLENHVTYKQELMAGDAMRFTGQLLDYDHKRLHAYLEMYHADQDYLAATYEFLALHVDMKERRSITIPAPQLSRLAALMESHGTLPTPEAAGSTIGIRR